MKKFFSLVLALVMALSLTTVAWGAATEVSTYAAFKAAVEAGQDVKLTANINGDGIVIDQDVTIDLGSYTYTIDGYTVGSKHTETLGIQILDGITVTIKNGTIVGSDLADKPGCPDGASCTNSTAASHDVNPKVDYGVKVVIMNYAGLTLDGVTVKAGNSASYAMSINSGDVTIKDTDIVTTNANTIAFDTCQYSTYPIPEVTVEGDSVINGDVVADGGELVVKGGTFNDDITVGSNGDDSDVTVYGGSFAGDVDDYLAPGVIQSVGGSVVPVPSGAAIPAGGPTLATDVDSISDPMFASWTAKVVAKKAENAKKYAFATYTIEMIAKVNGAPIWWDNGVEEKGEDVDFAVYGEEEFVKVDSEAAWFVVVDGKNITYFAPASEYNTNGWDEKAEKVTLPYAVSDKYECDNFYATNPAATTFYKFAGDLYVADANGNMVFNVNGLAVPAKLATTEVAYKDHTYKFDSKGNSYGEKELTKVYCGVCGDEFKFVVGTTTTAVTTFGVDNYAVAGTWNGKTVYVGTGYTIPSGGSSSTPSTDKVTSAETFDAGIAMYVGMSVMAAAGSAVVLKKRED